MSTPMTDGGPATATNGVAKPVNGMSSTAKIPDVISVFRPTKHFPRDDHGRPVSVLSLDFDDPGELLMTSESDEAILLYSVKEGKLSKTCLSKKYGAKHAKFTHTINCIVYASTKGDDTIRYLSTHDNSFLRYFRGHEKNVTCIAMNPGADTFVSCSEDDTVRIWDAGTPNMVGKLNLQSTYLAAWDPSANVIAVASSAAQTVLLYDFRNFDKEPFATFDLAPHAHEVDRSGSSRNWNKLEFSNDGKSILVGTTGDGHYLLDAFDGGLKAFLYRSNGPTRRLAAGQHNDVSSASQPLVESSGDCCFTSDGRYVLSGARNANVLVWDTLGQSSNKQLMPAHVLENKSEAAVVAFNPRYNMFATGDKEAVLWVPDLHSL